MARLGILGGGQLGRMTALAAARLGVGVRFLMPSASGPEAPFSDVTVADWTDPGVLRAFADGLDAVTVESEWAPAEALLAAAPGAVLHPGPDVLHTVRHKGRQRAALAAAGLPQPEHVWARTTAEAADALARWGHAVAKRFEGSYDGYGNATLAGAPDVPAAWDALAAADGLLVEAFVDFAAEVAVTVARRADGAAVVYPAVRGEHRAHRLHAATVPAGLPADVEAEARRIALETAHALGAVGVATVEMFALADGRVLVNEVAPRPHNTAHVTIEACHTSQFENHVRAVLGWPLGDPGLRVPAACSVNVLGTRSGPAAPEIADALAVPGASVHLYGKTETRPERKMGHVTVAASSVGLALARAQASAAATRGL